MTSINSKTEPLFIVDGVPMSRELLEKMVNPSDVENVTFLKDATAASIWGAQAANGVVVFTTKTGTPSSKPSVTYDGSLTWKGKPVYSYLDRMSAAEFIAAAKDVFDPYTYSWSDVSTTTYGISANYPIVYPHELIMYRYAQGLISADERELQLNTLAASDGRGSYEKNFMSDAFLTTQSVAVSGGGDQNSYYFSLDYQGSRDAYQGKDHQYAAYIRDVLRIGDWLKLDASLNGMYSRERSHLNTTDEFTDYSTTLPYVTYQDAEGRETDLRPYFINDAMADLVRQKSSLDLTYHPAVDYKRNRSLSETYAIRANLGVTVDLTDWLSYEGRFQWSAANTGSESFYDPQSFRVRVERAYGLGPDGKENLPSSGGHFTSLNSLETAYTVRNQLSFNKDFGEKHQVSALAGFELNSNKSTGKSVFLRGYDYQTMKYIQYDDYLMYTSGVSNPLLPQLANSTANEFDPNSYTQSETEYRFVSVYANAAYTLMDKYSLNASIRVDQSNLFGSDPSVQFKPIWSAGAIWNMKKEGFLSTATWLDRLNLRLSCGLAGNSPDPGQGGPYNLISSVSDPGFSRFGLGYIISTPANAKLTWEKTRTWNLGVDFSAFRNRLDISLDLYDKYTTNLLTLSPIDPTTGFTTVLTNMGEMSNRGVELGVKAVLLQKGDWLWSTSWNLTYNKNKLESMYVTPPGTPSALMGYEYWEGYPYGTIFAYRWAGLDSQKGLPRAYNENDEIVSQVADIKEASAVRYMGTTVPPWYGSLGTSLSWKGLHLECLFVYNLGHVMRNDVNTHFTNRLEGNLHRDFLNRWKNPGDELVTNVPAYFSLSDTSVNDSDVSSLYRYADVNVLDASFIKLRDLSLSYSLPQAWASRLSAKSLGIGARVSNIFTLAFNKEGIDPEAFSLRYGGRSDKFPPCWTLNLQIEF